MGEQSEPTNIVELTTEIVAAYVSNHKLQVLDIPTSINAVATALAPLGTEPEPTVLERPSQR